MRSRDRHWIRERHRTSFSLGMYCTHPEGGQEKLRGPDTAADVVHKDYICSHVMSGKTVPHLQRWELLYCEKGG